MERRAFRLPGFPMLLVAIAQPIATLAWLRYLDAQHDRLASAIVTIVGSLVFAALVTGFFVLSPNESRVVLFFGWYAGTVRRPFGPARGARGARRRSTYARSPRLVSKRSVRAW